MAEIRPIRPWRYNEELGQNIESLTSPLFDVVSQKQRDRLYENPINSIHLSVPVGEDAFDQAHLRLEKWKREGVIVQDQLPGIYVYYQYFTLQGSQREYVRKGFICNIFCYDWNDPDSKLLRHENTMPYSVNDRIEIMAKTQLNVSPTHGLYTDSEFELEQYMDESMKHPIYEIEDYQGVKEVLSVIHDAQVIDRFLSKIKQETIILADGHHRYEGSLLYRKKCMEENPNHTGEEGYNFHMMYLTNAASDDLRILPTHRLINGFPIKDEEEFKARFADDFIIKPVEDAHTIHEIILGKQWAFGILLKNQAFKVRLKPEVFESMSWNFPDEIKRLDLTVLHYFIIEKIIGIPGKDQRHSHQIIFDRSFSDCLARVIREEVDLAIITNEISIEQVEEVCHSGYTMPQKSTFFYPKVICGFLFNSIKDSEFQSPPFSKY